MFSHVSVGVTDLARAARFYDATLGALGYKRTMSEDFGNAWGIAWPQFWAAPAIEGASSPGNGVHVAFIAASREAVDRFHAAALAEGLRRRCAGPPGRLYAGLLCRLRPRPGRQQARGSAPARRTLPDRLRRPGGQARHAWVPVGVMMISTRRF